MEVEAVVVRVEEATSQCGEATFPVVPPAEPSCTFNDDGTAVKCT